MLQRLGGKHTGLAADGASANEASAEHIGCADRKPKAELLDSQFDHTLASVAERGLLNAHACLVETGERTGI
jgi:hypothetical protein